MDAYWRDQPLPSRAQLARLLKQAGLTRRYQPHLAVGRWFRSVRTNGYFDLGSYRYYLGKRFARRSVATGFDPDTLALICQPKESQDTIEVPIQGITKADLMGELAVLQALPMYQLALPFSLAAWRQLEYAHHLSGTTLRDFAKTG